MKAMFAKINKIKKTSHAENFASLVSGTIANTTDLFLNAVTTGQFCRLQNHMNNTTICQRRGDEMSFLCLIFFSPGKL